MFWHLVVGILILMTLQIELVIGHISEIIPVITNTELIFGLCTSLGCGYTT